MNKTALLAATVAFGLAGSALAASATVHKPYTMLWNQNSNYGSGVNSQVYESSMQQYDDFAADDFVVPAGQTWTVTELDVTGAYVGGSGPASSETIWIYRSSKRNKVNGTKYYALDVPCTDNSGSFQCILPGQHRKPGVKLLSGTYWVSIVANCASTVCGQWQWTENTTVTGNQAVWGNPQNGWNTGCNEFEPLSTCFGGTPADLAFDLQGIIE